MIGDPATGQLRHLSLARLTGYSLARLTAKVAHGGLTAKVAHGGLTAKVAHGGLTAVAHGGAHG
jgi:hypothetical protein